jgi:hypothetical protein
MLQDVTTKTSKTKKRSKLPVNTKRIRMIAWIKHHMAEYNDRDVTLNAVVLAPFDTGDTAYELIQGESTLQVLRGTDAVVHLGGLSQLLFWYASPNPIEDEDEDE